MWVFFDEVCGDLLDPFRLHFGHGAGVEFGGFDEFRRNHPFRADFEKAGAGEDGEFGPACAGVFVRIGLEADIAEHSGQYGTVDRIEARGREILSGFIGRLWHGMGIQSGSGLNRKGTRVFRR